MDSAATALRAYALSKEEGEFLGSEEDLIDRLKVSRPTLRQASARVAQEHLISIRRGVGGGYFAREPGSVSVSRIAALYLTSRNAPLAELSAALKPLRAELAMRAARNKDPALRDQLRAFAEDADEVAGAEQDYRSFLRSEREFGKILGKMGENSVLSLLLDIVIDLYAHVSRDEDVLINRPKRVREYRRLRGRLAQAILEGDVVSAELWSQRASDLIGGWMQEDFKGARFGDASQSA